MKKVIFSTFFKSFDSVKASKAGAVSTMKPVIMGILNCTPDSFFEGSRKQGDADIAGRVEEILTQGGTIIDVGAYSTRPGARNVSLQEEMQRMGHALKVIRSVHDDVTLSIDTFRPEVARMAVEEFGAQIINDVSEGGRTIGVSGSQEFTKSVCVPEIFREVARLHVHYILVSQQKDIDYMLHYFHRKVEILNTLGVKDIILDPGFGFGKDVTNGNYAVLRDMHRIKQEFPDLPLVAGLSRKRMIWQLLGCTPEDAEALQGTMLTNFVALQQGADILRVHDVKAAADTIKVFEQLNP